jgi:hypothetical protein
MLIGYTIYKHEIFQSTSCIYLYPETPGPCETLLLVQ